jgi:betaine-homocysteine S-methyltransferase
MSNTTPEVTGADARGLLERLSGCGVVCAEGYLFELERRGYLQAGAYVPEVVLEHPEALTQLYREFVHAGSDVIEAFTYYGHREKLRLVGKEALLESLNREAMRLAHAAAAEAASLSGGERPLVAGNTCNTNVYHPGDDASLTATRAMFEEQIAWAAEERADFVIGETFYFQGEAQIALEVIKEAGLPAVITLAVPATGTLMDGYSPAEAASMLADGGAEVVGLNCYRGPATIMPLLKEIRDAVSCQVAALPVPYRTTSEHPTFFGLPDRDAGAIPGGRPFPTALEPLLCNRYEIADFAREAYALGVRYLGVCCGNAPHYTRAVAEAIGRTPPASRYSPDMSKHFAFGTDPHLDAENAEFARPRL